MTQRVVVIGAGIAGLLAAAACRDAGDQVLLLERDGLDGIGPRPGVPQGAHAHIYLQRGLLAAERLVPGLTGELRAAGAVPFNTAAIAWRAEKGWYPAGELTFEVLSMTRPLFESVLRRTVLAPGGIDMRTGVRVSGLGRDGRRWQVHSVATHSHGDAADPEPADRVVDASGRSTRILTWLNALGWPAPRSSRSTDGSVTRPACTPILRTWVDWTGWWCRRRRPGPSARRRSRSRTDAGWWA